MNLLKKWKICCNFTEWNTNIDVLKNENYLLKTENAKLKVKIKNNNSY